jgi:hypothetical protein
VLFLMHAGWHCGKGERGGLGRDSLGDVRYGIPFSRHGILYAIRLVVLGVDRSDEQVLCEHNTRSRSQYIDCNIVSKDRDASAIMMMVSSCVALEKRGGEGRLTRDVLQVSPVFVPWSCG